MNRLSYALQERPPVNAGPGAASESGRYVGWATSARSRSRSREPVASERP
jgi:hypothetical protein